MIWDKDTVLDDDTFGFIYMIAYDDGTFYLGKKQVISEQIIPALKSLEVREGATRVFRHILRDVRGNIIVSKNDRRTARKAGNKATKEPYDCITKPAKWIDYEGSCENVGNRKVISKEILLQCKSKKELTYREEEALFAFEVLEDPLYLNDNIGGKYFRDDVKEWK